MLWPMASDVLSCTRQQQGAHLRLQISVTVGSGSGEHDRNQFPYADVPSVGVITQRIII